MVAACGATPHSVLCAFMFALVAGVVGARVIGGSTTTSIRTHAKLSLFETSEVFSAKEGAYMLASASRARRGADASTSSGSGSGSGNTSR
jgi:hypothetical protein